MPLPQYIKYENICKSTQVLSHYNLYHVFFFKKKWLINATCYLL